MASTLEQLVEQAMTLPSESRARLADLLVESLEGADLGRIEQLWITEAKRRRDEVRAGTVDTVDGEEALRQVRDSIRRWDMSFIPKHSKNIVRQPSGTLGVSQSLGCTLLGQSKMQ
jgi:hypothetical protein